MESGGQYKVPGEHVFDGMVFHLICPPHVLNQVKHFQFRPDDVLVATYPKAGTTWVQEIVWLVNNNADTEKAKTTSKYCRIPFIDVQIPLKPVSELDEANSLPSPRALKTHLPPKYFIQQWRTSRFKIIVVMRNLKDTLVSYYHFYQKNPAFGFFPGSFEEFFELFKKKWLVHGDWAEINLAWWKLREDENILILKYEDIKKDHRGTVEGIARFLGKDLSREDVSKILEHTTLGSMRESPGTAQGALEGPAGAMADAAFYRKGIVGDWVNEFNKDQAEFVDDMVRKTVEPEGLYFSDS